MANVIKPLFRGAATTGSSTLYTTPDATVTLITSIVVTNTTGSSQTYSISLDGVPLAGSVPVPANDSVMVEPKQAISQTDTITGLASSTSVYFHITGLEMR